MERFVRGFPLSRHVVSRFIAGDHLADAVRVAKRLSKEGFLTCLDLLGESGDEEMASASRRGTLEVIQAAAELEQATVSLKPTQIGLAVSSDLFKENLASLLDEAIRVGVALTVDMEKSDTVDKTVGVFSALRTEGLGLGIVLQAYLHRSVQDLDALIPKGVRVRLCKGAYDERPEVAFQGLLPIRKAYLTLAKRMLGKGIDEGGYPEFATHDPILATSILKEAKEKGRGREGFEFQMLHGINRPLQERLRDDGYRVRVYIPFGPQWYPYFMRRLAERPANLLFFLRAVLGK